MLSLLEYKVTTLHWVVSGAADYGENGLLRSCTYSPNMDAEEKGEKLDEISTGWSEDLAFADDPQYNLFYAVAPHDNQVYLHQNYQLSDRDDSMTANIYMPILRFLIEEYKMTITHEWEFQTQEASFIHGFDKILCKTLDDCIEEFEHGGEDEFNIMIDASMIDFKTEKNWEQTIGNHLAETVLKLHAEIGVE